MINGKRSTAKMTWQEFTEWQRWDEFPERADDPPMTVDVMFFYKGDTYFIDESYGQYHVLDKDWNLISSDKNLLTLLTSPIPLFGNKSFRDIISEIDFDA